MAGRSSSGGVTIDFIVEDKSVEAMLFRLDTALNPVAIAVFLQGSVDPWVRQRAEQRFKGEGDDVVGRWAPLKESTQDIRAQSGYGASHPINRREGELEDYIVDSPNRLAVNPMGATLTMPGAPPTGELKKKFDTAQKGKDFPRTVPRPVIGLNEQDLVFILTSLATYIANPASAGVRG
jgi:hypothetical protein